MQTQSMLADAMVEAQGDRQDDHLIAPDTILPAQFQDMWCRSRARTSSQRLALAMLRQAIVDLRPHVSTQARILASAVEWVASDDRSWPYSFTNVCELLNLSPGWMRAELLGDGGVDRYAA